MKKILGNTVYSDTTLKSWKKEDLIEHIRILEYNWASAEESLNIQAKNCEMLLRQASKETAEKIFKAIKSKNQYEYFSYDDDKYCVSSDAIEELARQFGVDNKLKTENKQDNLINEQLKQFAERLKEKMTVREYMGVKYRQGVFSENDIDETLKEFIDD